jgi:hypothetical protein
MIESRASRIAILCVLFAVLAVLLFWYGVPTPPDPQLGQVPTADHLATDADAYVGQPVQVTGTVVGTDPVVVETGYEHWSEDRYRTGTLEITVTGLATDATPGQTLQVYGTLRDGRTIDATNSSVRSAGSRTFMYGISALAGVWVLARLVRGWTVDWDTLAIEQRPEPLAPLARLYDRLRLEESTDA